MMNKLTKEEFIKKALLIHKDSYSYELVDYINSGTKIAIKCNRCENIFYITPKKHLIGQGCKKCSIEKRAKNKTNSTEQFTKKANLIHNNKYDYSLVKYKKAREKVKIICPMHGIFEQTPDSHITGKRGCPKCKREKLSKLKKKTTSQFIEESKLIYGNKYDYSLVNYINEGTKVKIKCNDCGVIFEQTPLNHFKYYGCSCKKKYKGEERIKEYLINNNIKFQFQKKFSDLKDKTFLSYDFYIPSKNLLVEYNGKQHYKTINGWRGYKAFLLQKHHDWLKRKYARKNNISLLTIPYWDFYNIEKILMNYE